ncbi:oligosaccharide flippase family protein [Paludisphaera mucosa]|uniref:Oligosaccharide flippase family protein n=1 Tax=Paludisphaera mucosa TaxID=3030827 RepID=A0ABT6F8N2_9BACT|nr:oligosaccharide flippase family protein [Paludisphaera mucosa]MDG3003851.1 oligosaccharide flippase family protein [Paludisphaera mucosa]
MASPTLSKRKRRPPATLTRPAPVRPPAATEETCPRARGRRIASNVAYLSLAELFCRACSVGVTLTLMKRLGGSGYGRVEFAFSVVFWLVLLVRDSSDVMVARELSRHPRLIKPLVDHVLAFKSLLAVTLFSALTLIGWFTLRDRSDWTILTLYGLMLFTTAIGLDFVYRGTERMGLLAVSLCLRTIFYGAGVLAFVGDASRIAWVPIFLAVGEAGGIALIWLSYLRGYRMPRPRFSFRFITILIQRGKTVCAIQLSQALIIAADVLVVGMTSTWGDVGRYGAQYRMVTVILTFGMIVQHATFPTLARLWRHHPDAGRDALDSLVEALMTVLIPLAVGVTLLAEPLVGLLGSSDYDGAGLLLAVGIWRAPLLTIAFGYQTTLIALNRETVGVGSLVLAAILIGPLVYLMRLQFGLVGATAAVLLIGLALVAAGYQSLAREGRQPAWHHHLARPLIGSAVMIPTCIFLVRWHVGLAVSGGAAAYLITLVATGGLERTRHWRAAFHPIDAPASAPMRVESPL